MQQPWDERLRYQRGLHPPGDGAMGGPPGRGEGEGGGRWEKERDRWGEREK